MTASQNNITTSTPMGATLISDGATFRVWAPSAKHVYVALNGATGYDPQPEDELLKDQKTGHWTGFIPGVKDGTKYRYYIIGSKGQPGRDGHGIIRDGEGLKRDPWARELEFGWPDVEQPDWPDVDCIVRAQNDYPWHDSNYKPPKFNELVIYQLHIGVYYARDNTGNDIRKNRVAKFLDTIDRIEYLADLGINAIQPLPFAEFGGEWNLGYSNVDFFSPEMDYCVKAADLETYLEKVNKMLAQKGYPPLHQKQLIGQVNQVKAFVDLCHLYGLAVITDVVYNHGGGNLDQQSLHYLDFPPNPDAGNSLYFTDQEWAGGKVFAYWKSEVRDFLIHNAKMFLIDYHIDGIRFDEVSVIDDKGGWSFCQDLTNTLRNVKPEAVLIAEYWRDHRWLSVWTPPSGMGFHLAYDDRIRDCLRDIIGEASGGSQAYVNMGRLKETLHKPWNFPAAWQAYNCIENHDLVLDMDGDHRKPRIPKLAHRDNCRSWYARSRTRVAMGILLTAPGVPMLFMGQEFLEDKLWSDNPHRTENFLWWDGLDGPANARDRHMSDHHRFTRDLIWLRRNQPALHSEPINVFHVDDQNRIVAFHRWEPGTGRDVVVVVSLLEHSFQNRSYKLGFPQPGHWQEVFNSDIYDCFFNMNAVGNIGGLNADGPSLHGLPHSGDISIPANGILVFARD